MGLLNFYIYSDIEEVLKEIKQLKRTFMARYDELKAKIEQQNTAIEGVAADIQHLKELVEQGTTDGLNAEQAQEILDLLNTSTERLKAIDAQTDSSTPPAEEPQP